MGNSEGGGRLWQCYGVDMVAISDEIMGWKNDTYLLRFKAQFEKHTSLASLVLTTQTQSP